jgi:hypothetical protein
MLPATGQTTSKSPGDDGALQLGVPLPSPRFTDSGNSTYTDNLTGLMWTKEANLDGAVNWTTALTYVGSLNSSVWRGFNDWRLPNKNELKSLIDYSQSAPATWLGTQGFSGVQASNYWTSTTDPSSSTSAWSVFLADASFGTTVKTSTCYLWPVRSTTSQSSVKLPRTGQGISYQTGDDYDKPSGASWPSTRFQAHGDGTVSDALTGLRWQAAPSASTYTWQGALDLAAGFSLGSFTSGWRLPNLHELASLVSAGQSDSSTWLNSNGFSGTIADYYWTSTASAGTANNRWTVDLLIGSAATDDRTNSHYVILVRSEQ